MPFQNTIQEGGKFSYGAVLHPASTNREISPFVARTVGNVAYSPRDRRIVIICRLLGNIFLYVGRFIFPELPRCKVRQQQTSKETATPLTQLAANPLGDQDLPSYPGMMVICSTFDRCRYSLIPGGWRRKNKICMRNLAHRLGK
jgi:hypothetical protein